jgi:hypothetical protein
MITLPPPTIICLQSFLTSHNEALIEEARKRYAEAVAAAQVRVGLTLLTTARGLTQSRTCDV